MKSLAHLLYTSLVLFFAAGCTASPALQSPAGSVTAEASAPAQAQPIETRRVTDIRGNEVEIPFEPQRVVAHYYAAEMEALGMPPLSTNYNSAQLVMSEEQLQGIENTGSEGIEPNLEKIVTLDPDLIVMPDFIDDETINALAEIAPTVVTSYSDDTFTRLRTLADILGTPEAAESWIESYLAKAEAKRAEVAPFIEEGETASAFILYTDGKLYLYGPQRLGPTMYDALGFTMPPKMVEMFEGSDALWEEISLELLPEYAGDRIFLVSAEDEETRAAAEEVMAGPLWQSLPAVQNGKAYVVTPRWGFDDPLTLEWLLGEMPALITQP